jgi:1,4-dihydroxy-2-naphthoate octaprenyltransferase
MTQQTTERAQALVATTTETPRPPQEGRAFDHAKNLLVHLRLPFQLTLAPFMLWGAAVSHARLSLRFALAFVILQICFYGGTTAFNSHYDRDEGPVGGLEAPPPAGPWLLKGSLALQGVGLALAALIDPRFFAVCLAYAALGFFYSHPSTRWKARPFASWAAVMLGQGVLGALAGVVASDEATVTGEAAWGLAGAALLVGALYPLTQLFQTEEDGARGDVTAAMALGRRGTCGASIALSVVGAACMSMSAHLGARALEVPLLALACLPMAIGALWVCRPAPNLEVFRRVSLVQIGAGAGFGAYTLLRCAS